jgi:hypothetical protein
MVRSVNRIRPHRKELSVYATFFEARQVSLPVPRSLTEVRAANEHPLKRVHVGVYHERFLVNLARLLIDVAATANLACRLLTGTRDDRNERHRQREEYAWSIHLLFLVRFPTARDDSARQRRQIRHM